MIDPPRSRRFCRSRWPPTAILTPSRERYREGSDRSSPSRNGAAVSSISGRSPARGINVQSTASRAAPSTAESTTLPIPVNRRLVTASGGRSARIEPSDLCKSVTPAPRSDKEIARPSDRRRAGTRAGRSEARCGGVPSIEPTTGARSTATPTSAPLVGRLDQRRNHATSRCRANDTTHSLPLGVHSTGSVVSIRARSGMPRLYRRTP